MLIKLLFGGLSIISIFFGFLYISSPETIVKLSQWANKVVFTDRQMLVHRKVVGVLLLAAGILFLYIALKI